jgi:uncharacterized membrane protein
MINESTLTAPTIAPVSLGAPNSKRIESIDLLRGVIMIIMAIDHVRDYFHAFSYYHDPTDLSVTTAPIFLTRWITHFCAPIFMLLAGISASLYGRKNGTKAVSFFLATRGLWLVFLEIFIVTLLWTFNPHYPTIILQVIWAFGISMMVLSLLVYLPRTALLIIGALCVFWHNALDGIPHGGNGVGAFVWSFLNFQNFGLHFGSTHVLLGYPVLSYIGIISLGYCLGSVYAPAITPSERHRVLRNLGLGVIALFIVVRGLDVYGDPSHWSVQKNLLFTIFSFVNTTKYPPSLCYTLMTLGPALLFLAYAEKPLNKVSSKIVVFGRVPMFFYLIHIPIIHGLAVLASYLTGHTAANMVDLTTWVSANEQLKGYGFSLPVVYLVWAGVIVITFPLCLWFSRYKSANQGTKKWLSYF